jgi:hypothetical protein
MDLNPELWTPDEHNATFTTNALTLRSCVTRGTSSSNYDCEQGSGLNLHLSHHTITPTLVRVPRNVSQQPLNKRTLHSMLLKPIWSNFDATETCQIAQVMSDGHTMMGCARVCLQQHQPCSHTAAPSKYMVLSRVCHDRGDWSDTNHATSGTWTWQHATQMRLHCWLQQQCRLCSVPHTWL